MRHYENIPKTEFSALVGMEEFLTKKCGEKLVGIQKLGASIYGGMLLQVTEWVLSEKGIKRIAVITRAFAENSEHRT